MRILITGATGFVGRALCARLARDGHRLVALVRSREDARSGLPPGTELAQLPASRGDHDLHDALEGSDAVVHLAGAPIFGKRWTEAYKRELADSRIALAHRLVDSMGRAARPPRTFVSANAVGYYGDRGDEPLREDSPPASDFLARLCIDWERAAIRARALGARVVVVRSGIVLGPGGGMLGALDKVFKLGLGGRVGSGRQYVSWIQRDDLVEAYARALVDPALDGPYNGTAPAPATNAELTRALGRALGRPTPLPVPAFALRLALGEAAGVLLASQRVLPARLQAAGFAFAHQELDGALRASLAKGAAAAAPPAAERAAGPAPGRAGQP